MKEAAVVISDTSPLRALHHLGLVDLLGEMFAEVLIPPAVADELLHPRRRLPPIDATRFPFVRVRPVADRGKVNELLEELQAGESEAIALALEVHTRYILMDEADGRAVARAAGLEPVGVLGILMRAKRQGLVPRVGPLLDRLVGEINFFLSKNARDDALRQLGELP